VAVKEDLAMAEQEAGAKKGKLAGWIKAVFTTVFGLVSGAFLMYLTPLIDRVIKPAKPLANFAVAVQGTQVTFQNRSTGSTEGWWDFGDGSALEPFSPSQQAIPHAYPRTGTFTAKLSLQNLLGEASEHAVNVQLDSPAAGPPQITAFQAVPTRADTYAPASFRVVGTVKNADLCVWALGEEQPLDAQPGPPETQERFVTLTKPGQHTLKLIAIQGKQVVQQAALVDVKPAPAGTVFASLKITPEAVRVEQNVHPRNVLIAWPEKQSGSTWSFTHDVGANPGWQIASAQLKAAANDSHVKDAKLVVAKDGSKVTLTGQMLKPGGFIFKRNTPLQWVAEILMTEERRVEKESPHPQTVAQPLQIPGSIQLALPPMQKGWVLKQRRITLDLYDGMTLAKHDAPVPANTVVMLQSRPWRLTATQVGDQVRIDVTAAPVGTPLTGN
jgi:hypothetical protein